MAATAGGIKAGKAFVIIDAVDRTGFVLKRVSRQLQAFGTKLRSMGRDFLTKGLMAALPAAGSMKIFASFDDAMRRVEARSTGSAQAMAALRDEAKLLGRTTSFTASQVADLMGKLAQKNFDRGEIKAMTGDIMNLARAAGSGSEEDTTLAADLVSGTLRAFKMEASQAGEVADIFSVAVNNSNFDLQGLMDGMKKAAPLAAEYGLSLQETTASLAAMTNLNIEASEAGTAFQSFLARMSQGQFTDAFNRGLEEAGRAAIKFTDDAGNLRKPIEIMQDIAQATEGMGTAAKGELLSVLFGVRQFGKAAGSISGGAGAVELLEKLNDAGGAAAETAESMDRGIGGSFRRLMSAVEGAAIEIGEVLAPTLAKLTDFFTENIGAVTEWIQENKGMVILIGGIIAGVIALGAALFVAGVGISIVSSLLGMLGTAIAFVKGLVVLLYGVIASPFFIVVAAIAGVIAALWFFSSEFRNIFAGVAGWASEKFAAMGETIRKTFGAIVKALGQGDFATAWELLVQGATLVWLQFVDMLVSAWRNFAGFFVEAWNGAMGSIKQMWMNAQRFIAKGILDLAAQQGMLGDMLDFVIGMDVSEEVERGRRLEMERMELALKNQQKIPGLEEKLQEQAVGMRKFAAEEGIEIDPEKLQADLINMIRRGIDADLIRSRGRFEGEPEEFQDKELQGLFEGMSDAEVELLALAMEMDNTRTTIENIGGMDTSFNDPLEAAKDQIDNDFDTKIDDAWDRALGNINDFNAATEEGARGRQEEINERKRMLDELVGEVEAREEARRQMEEEAPEGTGENPLEDALGPDGPAAGGAMAPTINQGLIQGTVEAAKTAYENSLRAPVEKGEQLDEDRNELLENIDASLTRMDFNIA